VDNSVRIEAGDYAGMQRLVEYISRCPFSIARMVTLTDDGDASKSTLASPSSGISKGHASPEGGQNRVPSIKREECFPFPKTGEPVAPERCAAPMQTLMEGIPRNFEVFDPLDFLAEVTQHIPQ
jgi:hypothetical protein